MTRTKEVETLYRSYLQTHLDAGVGTKLSEAFYKIGLKDESQAIATYLRKGPGACFILQGSVWEGRRCFVGVDLPQQAQSGDLWFDVVEVTLMILTMPGGSTSGDDGRWISTHPAYVWQFRTFLSLVEWVLIQDYFMNAPDLMKPERFESMDGMDFVTNLYHEEAVAYAHWSGKYLCRQFDLKVAKEVLKPNEFGAILPPSIKLWDEVEFALSEFVRTAVGQETVYEDAYKEYELQDSDDDQQTPDRMIYEEWDRKPYIGLSTLVLAKIGLLKDLPRTAYEFIKLQNGAPRS